MCAEYWQRFEAAFIYEGGQSSQPVVTCHVSHDTHYFARASPWIINGSALGDRNSLLICVLSIERSLKLFLSRKVGSRPSQLSHVTYHMIRYVIPAWCKSTSNTHQETEITMMGIGYFYSFYSKQVKMNRPAVNGWLTQCTISRLSKLKMLGANLYFPGANGLNSCTSLDKPKSPDTQIPGYHFPPEPLSLERTDVGLAKSRVSWWKHWSVGTPTRVVPLLCLDIIFMRCHDGKCAPWSCWPPPPHAHSAILSGANEASVDNIIMRE